MLLASVKMPTKKCLKHFDDNRSANQMIWHWLPLWYVQIVWVGQCFFLNFLFSPFVTNPFWTLFFLFSSFFFLYRFCSIFILKTIRSSSIRKWWRENWRILSSIQFDLVIWLSHTTSLETTCIRWQCSQPASILLVMNVLLWSPFNFASTHVLFTPYLSLSFVF